MRPLDRVPPTPNESPLTDPRTPAATGFVPDILAERRFVPRISSILVPVEMTRAGEAVIAHAAQVANALGARLVGVGVSRAGSYLPGAVEGDAADLLTRMAGARFARLSREVNAVCAWKPGDGPLATVLGGWAWSADLVILARNRATGWSVWRSEVEMAIGRTQRPLLLVERSIPWSPEDGVVVLWDGGEADVRALTTALPFLARAVTVTLLAPPWRQNAERERALEDATLGLLARRIPLRVVRRERGPSTETTLDHIKSLDPGLVVMAAWPKANPWGRRGATQSVCRRLRTNILLV